MASEDIDKMFGIGTAAKAEEATKSAKEAKQEQVTPAKEEVKTDKAEQPEANPVQEPEEVQESPAETLKKAFVPVNKFVDKKHELKAEKTANEQLKAENEALKARLQEQEQAKPAIDISKYFSDIKDDDIVDGAKMKTVLNSALQDTVKSAFEMGSRSAQELFEKRQSELAIKEQERRISDMAIKIDSDVAVFTQANPNVDIAAIASMLTQDDVNNISNMPGNYAENAYKLVMNKVAKLGISQPTVTKPENNNSGDSVDAMFSTLESMQSRFSKK